MRHSPSLVLGLTEEVTPRERWRGSTSQGAGSSGWLTMLCAKSQTSPASGSRLAAMIIQACQTWSLMHWDNFASRYPLTRL